MWLSLLPWETCTLWSNLWRLLPKWQLPRMTYGLSAIFDVFEDNNGALTVATTPQITSQSNFFAVKLHFFKSHVCTTENPQGKVHIWKSRCIAFPYGQYYDQGIGERQASLWDGIWTKYLLQKLTFMMMVHTNVHSRRSVMENHLVI